MQTLKAFVKKYDPSRPVTAAVSVILLNSAVNEAVDVIGINYSLHQYDDIHKKYPNKPIVASECCAVGTTRGWYLMMIPIRDILRLTIILQEISGLPAKEHGNISWRDRGLPENFSGQA